MRIFCEETIPAHCDKVLDAAHDKVLHWSGNTFEDGEEGKAVHSLQLLLNGAGGIMHWM